MNDFNQKLEEGIKLISEAEINREDLRNHILRYKATITRLANSIVKHLPDDIHDDFLEWVKYFKKYPENEYSTKRFRDIILRLVDHPNSDQFPDIERVDMFLDTFIASTAMWKLRFR